VDGGLQSDTHPVIHPSIRAGFVCGLGVLFGAAGHSVTCMMMKAWIEGRQNEGLTDRIASGATALQDDRLESRLREEGALLELLDEEDGDAFAERYLRELHARNGIDWNEYCPEEPRRAMPRLLGQVRALLLKLLRPPLDWLVFRQSVLNRQFSARLIDERRERVQVEAELRAELVALRTELAAVTPQIPAGEA